jgi:hypothetical protein
MAADGGDDSSEGSQRKRTQKKSAQKKSTQKRSTSSSGRSSQSENGRARAPRAESSRRVSPAQIARQAASDLLELTGKEPEGVTGLERSEDGWTVQVEVVELRRIPNTTDVLAVYEIETDDRGSLMGYRRIRRYPRGAADEGDR